MTQAITAPAGAAGRRPIADGAHACGRQGARLLMAGRARAALRLVAAVGLGAAANLAVVDGARAPYAGISRAVASPADCCAPGLVPVVLANAAFDAARTHLSPPAFQVARVQDVAGSVAGLAAEARRAVRRETRPVRFGAMRVERWIVTAVRAAAARTGADPVFMLALADKESSLRPDVGARTSSAEGLFQFIEQTWLEVVHSFGEAHGLAEEAGAITRRADGRFVVADEATREAILALRRDPLVSGLMAGEMLARDRARIEAAIGRKLSPHEVYLAHFLGRGGAASFLARKDEDPQAAAAKAFAAAARANRTIFYDGGHRGKPLSFAEVDARFAARIGERIDRYAAIDPRSESARARRLARLLATGSAAYARLAAPAAQETASETAPGAAAVEEVLVLATVAGAEGETVPLPPRARRGS